MLEFRREKPGEFNVFQPGRSGYQVSRPSPYGLRCIVPQERAYLNLCMCAFKPTSLSGLPAGTPPHENFRFLLVEDNVQVRRVVHGVLEQHLGWHICGETSDGGEAVRLFAEGLPDITLMDFLLPGISGLDASQAILEKFPDAAIILLTSHVSEQLKREAHRVGIKGVCDKAEMWNLLDAIDAVSRGESYFHS